MQKEEKRKFLIWAHKRMSTKTKQKKKKNEEADNIFRVSTMIAINRYV